MSKRTNLLVGVAAATLAVAKGQGMGLPFDPIDIAIKLLTEQCSGIETENLVAAGCIDWTGFSGCADGDVEKFIAEQCVEPIGGTKQCQSLDVSETA